MARTNNMDGQGSLRVGLTNNIYGEGYVWYNTSNNKIQYTSFKPNPRAWSASGNVNCAVRSHGSGGYGTRALKTMGKNSSGTVVTYTERYTGSTWNSEGSPPVACCQMAAAGNDCSFIAVGGRNSAGTEQTASQWYNGSTWSNGPSLNNCRTMMGAAGYCGWAVVAGGYRGFGNVTLACTEEYVNRGSGAFTNVNPMPVALCQTAVAGNYSCAISYGGKTSGGTVVNCLFLRTWLGGTWSTGPGSSVSRCGHAVTNGSQVDDFATFGGQCSTGTTLSSTEAYNGISWSTCGNMITGRKGGGYGSGNGCYGLANSGYTPTFLSTSEDWESSSTLTSSNLWIYNT